MSDTSRFNSLFLLVILSLIWGTSFILIKQGLKVFAPDEVGALRVSSAALLLLPMALTKLKELKGMHYGKLLLSGLLGIFIPAFLFALAQTRLDSSVTGIMNSLTPLFTMIIGGLFYQQRFRGASIIGIAIGLAGTVVLSLSNSGGTIGGFNAFSLLIVTACICYGTNLNFIKFKIVDLKALTITSVSLLLIGPFAITYLFVFTDFTSKLQTEPGAWKAFGFITLLGFMSTSVATILFNKLVKIATPLFASSVTYLIPVVAVGWGVRDGEHLSTFHYIGMAAIIGGVYLANRKR